MQLLQSVSFNWTGKHYEELYSDCDHKIMETWISSGLSSIVLQIQWFVDFLGRGHTVLWTRKSMSNNSSIVGGKLWWDLTVCRSEWRITNAVFQAWAASPTRPPCLWPLWQVFDWPLSSQFWGLCGRSRSCRHQLDFQDRRRCRWMFDKDLSTWFFPFQVPTPVCHPPNFKQTVTDMTASSANSIIFAYWVWHDPAQNGLKFKLNCFRGVWGGGGGSLSGETRTVDGNLLPVKAC